MTTTVNATTRTLVGRSLSLSLCGLLTLLMLLLYECLCSAQNCSGTSLSGGCSCSLTLHTLSMNLCSHAVLLGCFGDLRLLEGLLRLFYRKGSTSFLIRKEKLAGLHLSRELFFR
ncbi:hypothetical protein D3C85_994380 [compost metagenome]